MVFGDTFAARQQDWRSNTMAIIADPDPTNGLVITGMITDNEGHAAELLGSQKVDGVEMTVIPTYGTSIGGTMYLHYMSVRSWGAPGVWDANHAGIASSSDGGRTWTDHPEVRWPGNSGFVQVAFARHDRWQY